MKSIFKKYFLLLWVVIVAAYNAVLFLLFNQFAKETLKETSFWVIYGSMRFAFLVWLVIGLLERNTKLGGISPIVTFVYPYLLIIFLMTTIMLFFAKNILVVWVLVPMILISAVLIILAIFACFNRKWIKDNPQKVPELFSVEGLENYFEDLASKCDESCKNVIYDLASICDGLTSMKGSSELDALEKRLFEYASFIKQNAMRAEELNIYHNVEKFRELLKEREALVAKLNQ